MDYTTSLRTWLLHSHWPAIGSIAFESRLHYPRNGRHYHQRHRQCHHHQRQVLYSVWQEGKIQSKNTDNNGGGAHGGGRGGGSRAQTPRGVCNENWMRHNNTSAPRNKLDQLILPTPKTSLALTSRSCPSSHTHLLFTSNCIPSLPLVPPRPSLARTRDSVNWN